MIREMRPICSWIVRSRQRALSPLDGALEQLRVALDHAHRRADLVGEAGDQGADRREAFRRTRPFGRVAQRRVGALEVAREPSPGCGELPVQVLEVLLVPLRCTRRSRARRRGRAAAGAPRSVGRTLSASTMAFHDEREQQRQVEAVGPEHPARLDAEPRVHLADAAALGDVGVVEHRPGEREQVFALDAEQPSRDLRVAQQVPRAPGTRADDDRSPPPARRHASRDRAAAPPAAPAVPDRTGSTPTARAGWLGTAHAHSGA